MIACALVTIFFLSSAILVPIILRKLTLPPRHKTILIVAIIFSLFAKIGYCELSVVAMPDQGGDYTTWKTVAGLVAGHENFYVAKTDTFCEVPDRGCYNFAPPWAWISFGLDRFSHLFHGDTTAAFRLTLTAFLATTDVLIALILAYEYSCTAALVFLLAPLFIWIETYEGNFNNVALLLALLAWIPIRKKEPATPAVFLSAALTGLSLAIKHILVVFPVWLLFYRPLGKVRYRIAYAAVAYGIFFCSFLPWWLDPLSRAGIMERVFRYNGAYGFSVLGRVTELFVPISTIDAAFSSLPLNAFKLFWLILLTVIGILAARKNMNELLLCYLLALYGLSIGLFDEYLVIPMLVCAIFYKSWASRVFMLSSTGIIAIREVFDVDSVRPFLRHLPRLALGGHSYGWAGIFNAVYATLALSCQLCIIVLLVLRWRDRFAPEPGLQGSLSPPHEA